MKPRFLSDQESVLQGSVDLGEVDLSAIVKQSAQALRRNRPTAGASNEGRAVLHNKSESRRATKTWVNKSVRAPVEPGSVESAYAKGLAQAAGRELSAKQLSEKLRDLGFSSEVVDSTMARLQRERVIDDTRFAEVKVRALLRRGKGRRAISMVLNEHAISAEQIRVVLNDVETDWFELAVQARNKRFGSDPPIDANAYGRQSRFLAQRGFDPEVIRRVLQKQRN